MMSFKSENTKISFKSYVILALLLIAYMLVGIFSLIDIPKGIRISPFIIVIYASGILISTVFLIIYLKMLNDL